MARPGGNPDLHAHQFVTDRPEPLTAQLQLRVTERMKQELFDLAKLGQDWREFVRVAIAEKMEKGKK